MIVDDVAGITYTVKHGLEGLAKDYQVTCVDSGKKCLEMLEQNQIPDLILLDIMMPGTPVKNVVEQIKNSKIAFLSAVRTSEAEKRDLLGQKNIVDFIQKPFDLDDLIRRI